jgi:hypothetical protein
MEGVSSTIRSSRTALGVWSWWASVSNSVNFATEGDVLITYEKILLAVSVWEKS